MRTIAPRTRSGALRLALTSLALLLTAPPGGVLAAPRGAPGPGAAASRPSEEETAPGGAPGATRGARQAADLVLRGGAVYAMDAVRSWAAAIAVRGERIVYVGPDGGVATYVGPKTRVVNLAGKMVLPAFQDAHIHPVTGGISHLQCALYDAGTKSSDGHSAWVNSLALETSGVTKATPNPAGGRIDRDPKTGEPVGSLQDSAMDLVKDHAPPVTEQQRQDGLRYALRMLNGFGITSFQDADVMLGGHDGYRSLDTYRVLDEKGELTARVVESLWWERSKGEEQIAGFLEARRKYTKGRVRATTVKIMQDGVMEVQTAALLKSYVGKPGVYGLTMVAPEALKRAVTRLDKEGFQVHFHAIGDAAVRECLDAVEAARRANGVRDSRHHISHLELLDPADVPRFRQLGVVANFQPLWAFADDYMVKLTLPYLEPERARWLYPIGSLFRSGAVLAFGSDWSVSSANPLEEIEVAVTRMGEKGQTKEPFLPEERIALRDALAAFTIGSAYVNFQDDRTGSLEVGKLADLIVLDRNLFAIRPEEISEAKVLLTLLGGTPVHGDPASL